MTIEPPTDIQRAILDACISACAQGAPDLAEALREQLDEYAIRAVEHCSVCFDIVQANGGVVGIGPRLGLEVASLGKQRITHESSPLVFEPAQIMDDDPEYVLLLLWHEEGIVIGLEVSYVGDHHPALEDIALPLEWIPESPEVA